MRAFHEVLAYFLHSKTTDKTKSEKKVLAEAKAEVEAIRAAKSAETPLE